MAMLAPTIPLWYLPVALPTHEPIAEASGPTYEAFRDALTAVSIKLAQQIARDGEGATKFVTITVQGARSFAEARQGARVIATSALVKTALFGRGCQLGTCPCCRGTRRDRTRSPTHRPVVRRATTCGEWRSPTVSRGRCPRDADQAGSNDNGRSRRWRRDGDRLDL